MAEWTSLRRAVLHRVKGTNSFIHSNLSNHFAPLQTLGCYRSIAAASRPMSTSSVDKDVDLYSKKKQTPVSLKSLMDAGRGSSVAAEELEKASGAYRRTGASEKVVIQVACFLHRELPIRLATRAVKLQQSPLFLKSPSIQNVCSWYKTSFSMIRALEVPQTPEKEAHFAQMLGSLYDRHSATLVTLAKGAHEIRTMLHQDVDAFAELDDVQLRLDEFYRARIGIRTLVGQYLALRGPDTEPNMIGMINMRASPYEIAKQAVEDASYICNRTHGESPKVTIHGRTDLHFPFVSSYINYVLVELLKNSMRATIEHHGMDDMPPIRVVIADGEDNEDVVIKVSDEGGGISRSSMDRIWSYLYTTADPSIVDRMLRDDNSNGALKDFDLSSPLAGLGYGLPIARNYARIFEGDLSLMSMEGYGTDSFIYLPRLGEKETTKV